MTLKDALKAMYFSYSHSNIIAKSSLSLVLRILAFLSEKYMSLYGLHSVIHSISSAQLQSIVDSIKREREIIKKNSEK